MTKAVERDVKPIFFISFLLGQMIQSAKTTVTATEYIPPRSYTFIARLLEVVQDIV